MDVNQHMS